MCSPTSSHRPVVSMPFRQEKIAGPEPEEVVEPVFEVLFSLCLGVKTKTLPNFKSW